MGIHSKPVLAQSYSEASAIICRMPVEIEIAPWPRLSQLLGVALVSDASSSSRRFCYCSASFRIVTRNIFLDPPIIPITGLITAIPDKFWPPEATASCDLSKWLQSSSSSIRPSSPSFWKLASPFALMVPAWGYRAPLSNFPPQAVARVAEEFRD